jgi:hypothetical protein
MVPQGSPEPTMQLKRALASGVMVQDAVLDVPRVVTGLASTARQLGAHTLNYVAVVDIATEGRSAPDDAATEEHVAYRITLENRAAPSTVAASAADGLNTSKGAKSSVDIRARAIVNCTGSAVDTVRQYDTWLTSTLTAAASASNSGADGVSEPVTAKTHALEDAKPQQLVESCLTYEFFVVPRDGFVFSGAAGNATSVRPVFPSTASEGGAPLQAFISNTSLRNYSSITVLPFGTDGLLVGGAAPVRRPASVPTHLRQRNHSKSLEQHDESEGFGSLTLEQRRSIRRSVELLAEPLGMSIPGIASCRLVQFPLLVKPNILGNEVATQVEYRGFGALVGGAGGRGSMVHLLGGTAATCRRAAKEATDVVAAFLDGVPQSQPNAAKDGGSLMVPIQGTRAKVPCKTEFLQIVAPRDVDASELASNPANAVQRMVQVEYAQTVEDVIARRTQAAWMDPNRTRQAVPIIASLMAKELGWSAESTQRMIREANAFLDSIVI